MIPNEKKVFVFLIFPVAITCGDSMLGFFFQYPIVNCFSDFFLFSVRKKFFFFRRNFRHISVLVLSQRKNFPIVKFNGSDNKEKKT